MFDREYTPAEQDRATARIEADLDRIMDAHGLRGIYTAQQEFSERDRATIHRLAHPRGCPCHREPEPLIDEDGMPREGCRETARS